MPIETPHPLYKANIARWQKCRDAYEGEDAVKEAGVKYLPKVDSSQTSSEYDAYKARALYYEAVGRTVDGFVGAISRKPHTIEVSPEMEPLVDDATMDGTALGEFIKRLCAECLLIGRAGVLVDYDDEADRAYLSIYLAESIVNWSTDGIVLRETVYEADPDDLFAQAAVEQLRQLHLENGRYTVTLWRKAADSAPGRDWTVYEETAPTNRGRPLSTIPFFWLSVMGQSSKIEKPPLLGLVNVALSHYRTSADVEHGRHFTGLPTLWVTGTGGDEPLRIGAATAIVLSNPAARVGYAEFSGQGLGSLETALDTKEHQMAVLGALTFGGGKKGVEAAETARIRTSGENSLLMGVVAAVEEALKAALDCAAAWMGVAPPAAVELNRDFQDDKVDPQTLVAMVGAFQAGAMTLDAFLYVLQQSNYLPPETDIEAEAAKLDAAAQAKAKATAQAEAQAAMVAAKAHSKTEPGVPAAPRDSRRE